MYEWLRYNSRIIWEIECKEKIENQKAREKNEYRKRYRKIECSNLENSWSVQTMNDSNFMSYFNNVFL